MLIVRCVSMNGNIASDANRDSARRVFGYIWRGWRGALQPRRVGPIWQRLTVVEIEGKMYKTSVVLVLLIHLFIFFHLPHPTLIAAMSVQERTYIMVKVSATRL